ncbi:ubiquitin-conjugating enzyme (huntingtin interacting protein 2) [Kwoniella mangroviensis CBS 10435]|uniref:Ubiquitin-conjugating enzyme E2 1 n=1 Tax=Kwoniella mangroviensis CBS 10435 TaxID=1331196 RepID=A0A1B9ILW7_9TREE|nr:ubiquitin-conjugating enzyme (huntingtin interacting protein 2) [Kwoniella mangroviensis CBS 10435]OCF75180.1 ubiquitin-conjugating enzyme (huntingtin interacting protein 2) [Kwoniella mangroviensis CBS 8886]
MSDARLRRVQKEIKDCAKDKTSNISIDMIDESPFHLIGAFPGPPDTPYEGGYYEVDIAIPDAYPFQPVKMKFITKVYHPNVSSASGAICLDILKDAWSPVLTLKSTLISLQSLLCEPVPNDPQDAEVAKHYLADRNSFNATAKHWAQAYAQAPAHKKKNEPGKVATDAELAGLSEENVVGFTDMGFSRDQVISILKKLNYRGNNVNPQSYNAVLEELLK